MPGGDLREQPSPTVRVTFIARLDMAYPLKLAMEYDGRGHLGAWQQASDARRLNLLDAAGWSVLRFTASDVLRTPTPWLPKSATPCSAAPGVPCGELGHTDIHCFKVSVPSSSRPTLTCALDLDPVPVRTAAVPLLGVATGLGEFHAVVGRPARQTICGRRRPTGVALGPSWSRCGTELAP